MIDATVGDGHDFEPEPPFLLLEYLWQEGQLMTEATSMEPSQEAEVVIPLNMKSLNTIKATGC